jgi:Flp pilus assembly pilin Flp
MFQRIDLQGNLRGPVLVLTYFPGILAWVRARLGGPHGREDGVTAVEYALMVAVIALLLVAGFYAFFQAVEARYDQVGDCLSGTPAPRPEDCEAPAGG